MRRTPTATGGELVRHAAPYRQAPPSPDIGDVAPRIGAWLIALALAAALAIRFYLLVSTDFPIGDGGLFLVFVEAVERSFPALPPIVSYNGLTIPFAYPPLAFWLSAGAVRLGADPLAIVHQLPIVMNILYVLAFALLLVRMGYSRPFVAIAVLVFGTSLRSFEWLVMGGGLSRGLGSLFLLLTLLALRPRPNLSTRGPTAVGLVGGGVLVGCAVLSHLEWGVLAACSALIYLALGARTVRSFAARAMIVGLSAVVIVVPWFLTVYGTHGLQPFLAASGTSGWQAALPSIAVHTIVWQSSVFAPFIVIGAVVALRARDLFWFAFLLCTLFLTPRHSPTPVVMPLAVLAAYGILECRAWLARRGAWWQRASAGVAAGLCLLAGARLYLDWNRSDGFGPVPAETRAAMGWVAGRHRGATFAVINDMPWYYDASAEWFPALSGALSTTTAQGREWLPGQDFERVTAASDAIKASRTCVALLSSLRLLPEPQFIWAERKARCFEQAGYAKIYANPRVSIFRAADLRQRTAT